MGRHGFELHGANPHVLGDTEVCLQGVADRDNEREYRRCLDPSACCWPTSASKSARNVAAARSMSSSCSMTVMSATMDGKSRPKMVWFLYKSFHFRRFVMRRRELGIADEGSEIRSIIGGRFAEIGNNLSIFNPKIKFSPTGSVTAG